MPESAKTMIYVCVAALVLLCVAILHFTQTKEDIPVNEKIGSELFADLTDPLDAKSLEIVKYDPGLAQLQPFKVANVNNRWVIPSHSNYPADAADRLKDMAGELMGVKIVGIATELAKEHEQYGVIEPDDEALKGGEKGVGELIRLEDATGNVLAAMIVGEEVKDADGQRFVRVPGQDTVFVANVDLTKFSRDFKDWIELDLLDFNPFDLDRIFIKEYAVVPGPGGRPRIDHRSEMGFRQENSTWELTTFELATDEGWGTADLMSEEELDQDKLNELKRAIDELEIVDVTQKPKALARELAVGDETKLTQETALALQSAGFRLVPNPAEQIFEIIGSNGELVLRMKEGYEYRLRFGGIAGLGGEESSGVNRYVFVTARVVPDHFPKPTPPTLPELPSGPDPAPAPAPEAPPSEDDQEEDSAADDTEEAAQDDAGAEEADADEGADKDESADEPVADDTKEKSLTDRIAEIEAKRSALQLAYNKELEKWEQEKGVAEAKVNSLNARFADWFFIVSEDVFQKLHLGRDDIIKEKASAAVEGFGIDAFRSLEEGGLKKKAE